MKKEIIIIYKKYVIKKDYVKEIKNKNKLLCNLKN